MPSPGRTQKGNSSPTGTRLELPSAAGAGWCAGPWLWGVGEHGHGVPRPTEDAFHPSLYNMELPDGGGGVTADFPRKFFVTYGWMGGFMHKYE